MKKILLRADDLGYSEAVNYGIEKSVKEGIINNVGVMVNMSATAHGVNLLEGYDISFGLHSNICAGKPLTNPNLIPSITNKNGVFKSSKEYREAEQDFVNYSEVLIEIEAQYKQFVKLFNKKPDYLDGHAVASENFFDAMKEVANKYGVKYSGIPQKNEAIIIGQTKVAMTMESMQKDYDPFDMLKRVSKKTGNDIVELLVFHPGYLDSFIIKHSSLLLPRTQEVEMLVSDKTKNFIEKENIQLVSYRDL